MAEITHAFEHLTSFGRSLGGMRMAWSSKSNYYSQSQPQVYGWYTFCCELLYGIVVVTWYLLAFAERADLKVLTKLEKTIVPPLDDLPGYRDPSHVPFQDERASLSGPGERSSGSL